MNNYSHYKVADYLSDESFRQWVLNGAFRNQDSAWSSWLLQNPAHNKEALKARDIILATGISEEPFADDYFETIRRETLSVVSTRKRVFFRPLFWRAAAAILLLSGAFAWYILNKPTETYTAAKFETTIPAEELRYTRTNNTEFIIPVELPDGSSVLLHPHSSLAYEKNPAGNRKVHLTGKAFFEVTKNPESPFIVYAGEMVTKVLGTSFTITAYAADKDFSVVVKTGKVAVSALNKRDSTMAEESMVNLIPNEQLVFNREKTGFVRKDVASKEMLNFAPPTQDSYAFQDTPVADIFQQIGKAYGLKIDMDASVFDGCELTTNLTDEPLFEKLNIVCNSIGPGTSYVVENDHIRVISNGCNK